MTVYSVVLFLHVGAAMALASALSIDALILFQLRRATFPSGTKSLVDLWQGVPRGRWRFGSRPASFRRISGPPNVRRDGGLAKSGCCGADSDRHSRRG